MTARAIRDAHPMSAADDRARDAAALVAQLGETATAAHSPRFDVAEEAILIGAAVLEACARVATAAL